MDPSLIALAVFSVFSFVTVPFKSSMTTILALLIVDAAQRAANRHLAAKPQVLRRLRRQLFLGMSVGVLLESVIKGILFFAINALIVKYVYSVTIPSNITVAEGFDLGGSLTRDFLARHPVHNWGRGTLAAVFVQLPLFASSLITPWVLTLDYLELTSLHCRLEEVTREILVKDIVSFAAAGASGMRISYIFLWWLLDLLTVITESHNQSWGLIPTLKETTLDVMVMLRTSIVIIICQMAFCMAAAEHHVLEKKRRFWIALGHCMVVCLPFHYKFLLLVAAPRLNLVWNLLRNAVETIVALGFLEYLRRRYCSLLSASRQMDAENVMLPAQFSIKAY